MPTIQNRRGTAAQWVTANPTLAAGELGYETDTNLFKVGNGTLAWTALPYTSGPQGAQGLIGPQGVQGTTGVQGAQGGIGAQGSLGAQGIQGLVGAGYLIPNSTTSRGIQYGTQTWSFSNTGAYSVGDNVELVAVDSGTGGYVRGSIVGLGLNSSISINVTFYDTKFGGVGPFSNWRIRNLGVQGIQGAQGPNGPQGAVGPQGTTGAQGVQGFVGSQGPTGTQGVQGLNGLYAAQGIQGIQGITGVPDVLNTPIVIAGSSYNLTLADKDKMLEVSTADSFGNVFIPTNATVPFSIGTQINIVQTSTNPIYITYASGVTINSASGNKLRTQWSTATLYKRGINSWLLFGDLSV